MKTKSWFASLDAMDYICDNWTILSTVLDYALEQLGPATCLALARAGGRVWDGLGSRVSEFN